MRVLLGVDGSVPSTVAEHLVETLPWPQGTTVRIASVVVPPVGFLGAASPGATMTPDDLAEIEGMRVAHAHRVVDAAARAIGARGVTVQTSVLDGAAARELTALAFDWAADLIVVGSHGHGGLGGLLLGSVSAEIVDHAPCPVLIARTQTASHVMVAVDGSTAASRAVSLLATWPVFHGMPTTVVTVAPRLEPDTSDSLLSPRPEPVAAVASGGPTIAVQAPAAAQAPSQGAHERYAQGLRVHAQGVLTSAVDQLRQAGVNATPRLLQGSPAGQIVEAAAAERADLIVVGTRGLTGLARLRLGSTARGVLHAAAVSVLVVPVHSAASEHGGQEVRG